MATPILSDRVNAIDQLTVDINQDLSPTTLIESYDLLSFCFMPGIDDMICLVRDRVTGEIKPALGSNLIAFSCGEDA